MQRDDPGRTLHYLGIVILQYGSHWMCQRCGTVRHLVAVCQLPSQRVHLHQVYPSRWVQEHVCGCVCSPLPIALSLGLISNVELHGHTVSCIICTSWGQFNRKPDKPGTNNGTLDVISVSLKASYKTDLWDRFSAEFNPHNLLCTTNNSEVRILVFSSW